MAAARRELGGRVRQHPGSTTALRAALAFMAQTSRARVREGRGADGGGAARARGSCATAPRFNNCVEGKNRQEVANGEVARSLDRIFGSLSGNRFAAAAARATGVSTANVTASLRRPWHRHAGGEFQAPSRARFWRARFCSGRQEITRWPCRSSKDNTFLSG